MACFCISFQEVHFVLKLFDIRILPILSWSETFTK